MSVTVDDLLKSPFMGRNMDEKLKIVLEGKPKPPLKMSAVTFNETDGSMLEKQFDSIVYDQVEWLTGCDSRGSVFCWPCLLFKAGDLWSTTGISDLILLEEGMSKHESSPNHIEAVSNLKSFIQHNLKISAEKLQIRDHQEDEFLQRNREIIKFLTETVCTVAVKDVPTRLQRKSWCRLDMEKCIKTLQFLRIYNTPYTNHINDTIALIKISPDLLDDIADSVTEVLRMAIKKDMQASTYVSVIISEHSENNNSSQISTILRYLKDDKVYERFIGFTNMGKRTTPAAVYNHINKVAQEFGFSDRLLALSVDGGVFKEANELTDIVFRLKTNYPNSYFVPCYFHGLHQVLRQSLSSYKECSKFFKTFSAMEAFFQTDSNRWRSFENFIFDKIPLLKKNNSLKESRFLKSVNSYRPFFIEFCNYLEQNSKFWSNHDVAKACGFKQFLEDFETVFLLQVFNVLFEHTNTLETSLRSKTPENAFGFGIFTMVIGDLTLERDEGFEALWNVTTREVDDYEEPAAKKLKTDEINPKLKYKELFINIFQRSITEIQTRFNKLNVLQFCRLLNLITTEKATNNQFLPKSYRGNSLYNDYVQRLMETQHPFFDEEQLKNEISALRSNNSPIFCEKSDCEMLQLFRQKNLQTTLKNLYRLAELILTMPFRMPNLDGTPNKLEKMLNFSYTPAKMLAPGDISVLHIEKDLLQYYKRDVFFHDEVMGKFHGINNTIELIQNLPK